MIINSRTPCAVKITTGAGDVFFGMLIDSPEEGGDTVYGKGTGRRTEILAGYDALPEDIKTGDILQVDNGRTYTYRSHSLDWQTGSATIKMTAKND